MSVQSARALRGRFARPPRPRMVVAALPPRSQSPGCPGTRMQRIGATSRASAGPGARMRSIGATPRTGAGRATLALAGAVMVLVACTPLEPRSLFASPAYDRAVSTIDRAGQRAAVVEGPYRAGWARVPMALPAGAPLGGYGVRLGAPSTGPLAPPGSPAAPAVRAFAIAVASRRVVIFTADLLLVTPEIAAAVRAALAPALSAEAVFFTASHTHSGPGGYGRGLLARAVLGPSDDRASAAIIAAHVAAATQAIATLSPVRLGATAVPVAGVLRNRVERGGPVDDRLFVLAFASADGRRAALWSYGGHAVVQPPEDRRLSADYPGATAARLEPRTLEVAGFAAGGVGSSVPQAAELAAPAALDRLARTLAPAVEAAVAEALQRGAMRGPLAYARVRAPLPPAEWRPLPGLAVPPAIVGAAVEVGAADFGAVALGDVVLAFMPAELSGELTAFERARARRQGITLALLPFDGDWVGYAVARRVHHLPPAVGAELFDYETRQVSFFGEDGADLLLNLTMRMAHAVHRLGHRSP